MTAPSAGTLKNSGTKNVSDDDDTSSTQGEYTGKRLQSMTYGTGMPSVKIDSLHVVVSI
jgi:uridine phosphorylase